MKADARHSLNVAARLLVAFLWSASAMAQSEIPATTYDGLERVDSARLDILYWRPGASLAPYKRIALLDCPVEFVKDWELNQGERRKVYRATAEDMERIRGLLAEEFRIVFTRALQAGGYEIVDAVADDVLLLRPAIVNLDVAAPDLQVPGNVINYVATTGEMTLFMELYDSATNSPIGRVIDRQEGSETGGFQISDSVTNRAEADRILGGWAGVLVEALDAQWSASR
jgi:Protein of unknown function (DUF3313)